MTERELLDTVVRPALAETFVIEDQRAIWTTCTLKQLANEEETWAEEDMDFKHLAWSLNHQLRERAMSIKIDARELNREMTVAELESKIWRRLQEAEAATVSVVAAL